MCDGLLAGGRGVRRGVAAWTDERILRGVLLLVVLVSFLLVLVLVLLLWRGVRKARGLIGLVVMVPDA